MHYLRLLNAAGLQHVQVVEVIEYFVGRRLITIPFPAVLLKPEWWNDVSHIPQQTL